VKVSAISRITSAVFLFGGAALFVMWVVSPASSAPQTPNPNTPSTATEAPASESVVEPVRLPDTEAPAPEYRVPVRDPFAFESRPRSPRVPAGAETPAVVRPQLPSLVAILTDTTPAGDVRRAALSDAAGEVRIVRAGDVHGAFTISDVRPDVLVLVETSTGDTYHLALR
jgi:hypothetical protein